MPAITSSPMASSVQPAPLPPSSWDVGVMTAAPSSCRSSRAREAASASCSRSSALGRLALRGRLAARPLGRLAAPRGRLGATARRRPAACLGALLRQRGGPLALGGPVGLARLLLDDPGVGLGRGLDRRGRRGRGRGRAAGAGAA